MREHGDVQPGAQAAGDGGVTVSHAQGLQVGDRNVQHNHFPAAAVSPVSVRPAAVPAPDGLVNVAVAPGVFVGRGTQLRQLDEVLAEPGAAVVQAVHGLGGVGKSTLAAQWAWQHRDRYRPVWWIDADTTAGIDAGLATLATALQTDLPDGLSLEVLRERALQWLASHDGWLLVLDNVNDPGDVARLSARVGTGRVLVTSRRATGWAGIATAIALDVLDLDDAVEAMRQVLAGSGRDRDADGLVQVARELGCLPLAVDQAAAYLAETGLSSSAYLQLLKQYPANMFAHGGEGAGERTIARVWRVTLDRLADTPLAGKILRVVAWYAPDAIYRALLAGLADPPTIARALGRLAAYSMITLDEHTLTVHRLVQAVARTPDPEDPHRQPDDIDTARTQAIAELRAAMPDDWRLPKHWPRWRALVSQVEALAEHSSNRIDNDTAASSLYNQAAVFLHDQGVVARTIPLFKQALSDRRRLLSDDHPDTLTSVNNLASAYKAAGDLGRAIPLFKQALSDRRRLLGDDHPGTLTLMLNLAGAYEQAGDVGRAVPLLERTLSAYKRILGDDHADTLNAMNGLASACASTGDLGRAVPLFEQSLTDCRRVLGEDHPQTLIVASNLASAYTSAGDVGPAVPSCEQSLTDCRRVFGDDHPQTLSAVRSLAHAYEVAGDVARAIPLLEQSLTDYRRTLGDDHPDTLSAVNSLAFAWASAGDVGRAVPLFEQSLTDCRRVLGDDHPHTLTLMNNLASAYEHAGDVGRAIPLFEQSLTGRRRVLGDRHPDTLASMNNLANAYEQAGDMGRAVPLFEQAFTGRRRVLGDHHPDTVLSLNNLATAYWTVGDVDKAVPLLEQSITYCRRVFGDDAPGTVLSLNNLAFAYRARGDVSRAVPLFEQALAGCRRVFGDDDPRTKLVEESLTLLCGSNE
ncbi:Nephrocystin-3 [Actinoplanes sp. SE50]|nr:Nephrocystin-3 [Actinoplanes sp. SE50/110]ATO85125.1 Nephrocystin-3 [Actinoplanes sp. SE50]SLM02536.1 TPR repeat domain protein [Actinoplanes sp. SE50/110]